MPPRLVDHVHDFRYNRVQESTIERAESDDVKRWTAKRWVTLVLEVLRGDTSSQEAARKHGLTVAEIEDWKERFLSGAENALRSKPLDEEALKEAEIKKLKQKVGELVMDIDILKEAVHASVN